MQKQVDVYDYMNVILKQLKTGVLITVKENEKVNSMTIAWGQIGIEWNKLIFTTYIRKSRFTYDMLDRTKEFTVNIPMEENVKKILTFCGFKSGRDFDKVKELDLHLVEGNKVTTPGIKELPLTLECKLIYKQIQNLEAIPDHLRTQFYPNDKDTEAKHTMFYGEIVGAYLA